MAELGRIPGWISPLLQAVAAHESLGVPETKRTVKPQVSTCAESLGGGSGVLSTP